MQAHSGQHHPFLTHQGSSHLEIHPQREDSPSLVADKKIGGENCSQMIVCISSTKRSIESKGLDKLDLEFALHLIVQGFVPESIGFVCLASA